MLCSFVQRVTGHRVSDPGVFISYSWSVAVRLVLDIISTTSRASRHSAGLRKGKIVAVVSLAYYIS